MRVYSYVVHHDEGREPNPYFGSCTLCRCKYSKKLEKTQGRRGSKNIVELANEGDWVIGTGGAGKKSAGHGKLIYAMRVDERLNRWEYYKKYKKKKPERPHDEFQSRQQFALVSHHFYYFGKEAIDLRGFEHFQKKGPGFRYVEPKEFGQFLDWLRKQARTGKRGEPCWTVGDKPHPGERCKSSC